MEEQSGGLHRLNCGSVDMAERATSICGRDVGSDGIGGHGGEPMRGVNQRHDSDF
jgi:hypothetical protein